MYIYRALGDRIGTGEARELAQQLVSWHDAMVKHLRALALCRRCNVGTVVLTRKPACCGRPHRTFGVSASQLEFLRSHGQRGRSSTLPSAGDRAAEMGA